MIRRIIGAFCIISIMFPSPNSARVETDGIQNLVEASGYLYLEESSGITKLPYGYHVLRVFMDVGEGLPKKSVIVIVNDRSVIPLDTPVWSGDSVQIQVLDINLDGEADVVVSEYYEPSFNVRVFFNSGMMKFNKVLQQNSVTVPEFLDIGQYFGITGHIKEVILTKDPYQSRYDSLFCAILYAFNGKKFQQVHMSERTELPN